MSRRKFKVYKCIHHLLIPQQLYVGLIIPIFLIPYVFPDIILETIQEKPPALLCPLLGVPIIRGGRVAFNHVQERGIVSENHEYGVAGIKLHHLPYAFDRFVGVFGAIRSVEWLYS